jgi:hypothetical protein
MICRRCRTAADHHRPADDHCDSTGGPSSGCSCQHRTNRYSTSPSGPLTDVSSADPAQQAAHFPAIVRRP